MDSDLVSYVTLPTDNMVMRPPVSVIVPRIVTLLEQSDQPTFRRAIQSSLVFNEGCHPVGITNALKGLSRGSFPAYQGLVIKTELAVAGQETPCHIYSYKRPPTDEELRRLAELNALKDRVLANSAQGHAGEKYFRAAVIEAGYTGVTQEKRLGYVFDANKKNALDLKATSPCTGIEYGISVKNQVEWLDPGGKSGTKAIKDCYAKAKAHNLLPWLVVPFATDSALARCNSDGIRLTVLSRQIVPAEDGAKRRMRDLVEQLREVIGPQPFEFLYNRPSRTINTSIEAQRDIETILREDRITG